MENSVWQAVVGHVCRFSGLARTMVQDTVTGKSRTCRQKKRWEDNIKKVDMTGSKGKGWSTTN